MNSRSWMVATVMAGAVTTAAIARAQPGPTTPDPAGGGGSGSGSGTATGSGSGANGNGGAKGAPDRGPGPMSDDDPYRDTTDTPPRAYGSPPPAPEKPRKPDPKIDLPTLLSSPTGWLLPAAVLYSRTALDTGGGVSSDNRVGLGDVAEFGVASTDSVRIKDSETAAPTRIQPYVTATFRMGVAENRLFANQPGLVLGFLKSFERNKDNFSSRIAELTLIASKKLGSRVALHVGGALWDAELGGKDPSGVAFKEQMNDYPGIGKQIRPFGGIQVRPLDKSEILVDVDWAPEFCKTCSDGNRIRLQPQLSWGVRYEVADYMHLESGVRLPDIQNANLLDAQIFGQVTFTSWALRHGVDSLK